MFASTVLTLAACGPAEVALPDVSGEPVTEALATLEEAGFEVDLRGLEADDDNVEAWTVRSQTPASGQVTRGETITIRVRSILNAARDACDAGEVADGGRTLVLDMHGEQLFSGDLEYADVRCVLDELDVPQAVLTKMGATRSLDGRQEDDWNGINASWSYHPRTGLDVVLELD
ncbi:PASTA domain-containing protein [Cellulomonas bogoriensis]|uniref:PASTA domain-containing protein n=1 Tax=Cellulomonas bogoriensis TaxID=301388 RepID=UPI000AAD7EF6|nr:PASTA domain-containing protein [Cellulomonas bogoriensis]